MTILFDYQAFEIQNVGGISRYFSEIISNFSKEVTPILGLKYSNNLYVKNIKNCKVLPFVNHKEKFLNRYNFFGNEHLFSLKKSLSPSKYQDCHLMNQNFAKNLVSSKNYDVFHPTYYDDYFIDFIENKPFVLTIHDMIHEKYPEFFLPNDQTSIMKNKLAHKAAHVIAVSENTKRDIIEILGIEETKISVVYHGFKQNNFIVNFPYKLPEKYLLYVGERIRYKNFLFLINSIHDILIDTNTKILCIGSAFNYEEIALFKMLGIGNQIVNLFAEEILLPYIYKNAVAFIFPSLYEGFGIPIIEAFVNECPVILSNSGCFNEIASFAALYFNPKARQELRDVVFAVINDEKLRKNLISKGKERLTFFSWEKSASETLLIYKKIS